MKTDQLKRLQELERENERLRRAVSDLMLILKVPYKQRKQGRL